MSNVDQEFLLKCIEDQLGESAILETDEVIREAALCYTSWKRDMPFGIVKELATIILREEMSKGKIYEKTILRRR